MTKQEINEAIAVLLGWRRQENRNGIVSWTRENELFLRLEVPDFAGDLNLIAALEANLDVMPGNMELFHEYEAALQRITKGNAIFASALHRATAYLEVMTP